MVYSLALRKILAEDVSKKMGLIRCDLLNTKKDFTVTG